MLGSNPFSRCSFCIVGVSKPPDSEAHLWLISQLSLYCKPALDSTSVPHGPLLGSCCSPHASCCWLLCLCFFSGPPLNLSELITQPETTINRHYSTINSSTRTCHRLCILGSKHLNTNVTERFKIVPESSQSLLCMLASCWSMEKWSTNQLVPGEVHHWASLHQGHISLILIFSWLLHAYHLKLAD